MGSCVSKRSRIREEPYALSMYMNSNDCYLKNIDTTEIPNNHTDVSQDYYEFPARQESLLGDTSVECTYSAQYTNTLAKRDKYAYDKPLTLALPWPQEYAPSIPHREPPHNPDWRREDKAPPEYTLTERSGTQPFKTNDSISWNPSAVRYHCYNESESKGIYLPTTTKKTDFFEIEERLVRRDSIEDENRLKPNNDGLLEISNTRNGVFAPLNSGVLVVFPKGCSPVVKYQVKCKIHTDFKPFTNHVSWLKDEWFIGPIPELTIANTNTLLERPFWNHVCIMVPHCVEAELLPYIRVHYSKPENGKYGKVIHRLDKPETYIPKVPEDPDECFIVTEKYVWIYTRHFTQFICTCTKKSQLRVEGFLFGSQRFVTGEQEVNLRLYLCKQIYQVKDFAQELISREKKLHVGRWLIERFSLRLPFKDVLPEDRLDVTLTSAEGISQWKPPSAPYAGQVGDHHLKQTIWFDELQPCDSCNGSQSSWSPIEVTRLLVHQCGNRLKQQFRGLSTVDVMRKAEAHPVTTTNMHFTMDLLGRRSAQGPTIDDQRDHLGYAFREIANSLKIDLIWQLARQVGIRDGQLEAIEHRFKDDLREQKMQVLITWMNKEGKSATVEKLIFILLKLEPAQRKLADELCTFIFGQSTVDVNPRLFHNRPLPDVPSPVPSNNSPGRRQQGRNMNASRETLSSTLSPSSSIRTQFGIPESEPNEETERTTFEETQPKELTTIGEEEVTLNAEPVYVLREASNPEAASEDQQEHRSNAPDSMRVSLASGGYPNLPNPSNAPIQVLSSLASQLASEHEEAPQSVDDNSQIEDDNIEDSDDDEDEYEEEINEIDISLPDRQPNLDEVLDVRDIQVDGEDVVDENDTGEGHNDKNGKKWDENIEVLILGDLVLKDLHNTQTCHVSILNDLDFRNASNMATKDLPKFRNLKAVVLHCGFRHSKKDIDTSLKVDIKEAINNLDQKYPDADVYLSAVLPCRGNKNRVKIVEVNAAIEKMCEESTAEFLDLTSEIIDPKTGKPDISLYGDTVSLNSKGVKKISKILKKKFGFAERIDVLTQLGIKTIDEKDDDKIFDKTPFENVKKNVEKLHNDTERSWFGNCNQLEFTFSGL